MQEGVGLIEVITIGHRRDDEVYADAYDLIHSGKLSEAEQTQIWDALTLIEDTKVRVGLEDWDYMEDPAPEGLIKSAVASGALDETSPEYYRRTKLSLPCQRHGKTEN